MSPAMITEVMVLSTRLGQLAESTEAPLSDTCGHCHLYGILMWATPRGHLGHPQANSLVKNSGAISGKGVSAFDFSFLACVLSVSFSQPILPRIAQYLTPVE
jgi:hypothetical protein